MNVTYYRVGHVHYYNSCTIRFYTESGGSAGTAISKDLNGTVQDQSVTYDVSIPSSCVYITITMNIGGADTGSDSQKLRINSIS